MDWLHILNFAAIAIVIEVSPGPNFMLICKTVTWFGISAAMANVAGFAVAFMLHGTLSIFGLPVLLLNSSTMFFSVKLLGAGYLFYLGAHALVGRSKPLIRSPAMASLASNSAVVDIELTDLPRLRTEVAQEALPSGFREGLITNCLNPKISLFYLAVFPSFLQAGQDTGLDSFLFVLIHVMVNAAWFFLVAVVIERFLKSSDSDRIANLMSTTSGIALIGFSTWFALSAIRDAV
jgi:threonine/homoserine/homoserine lactone efflux protein